ncbi:MAG: RsmE family RNA methyltransferase [Phycisphaeraceae bacterium]
MAQPPRFYCPDLAAPGCTLDSAEARHARKVLRLGPGDAVLLFDGRGGLAPATLESCEAGSAFCRLTGPVERHRPPLPRLEIASAVPKAGRAGDMVNQLSQLGVDRLIPLRTARAVVEPRDSKLDRFRRQTVEAAKQSHRLFLMQIDDVTDFADVLAEPADLRLLAAPAAEWAAELPARLRSAGTVRVLVGPEGGWTGEEAAAAREAGYEPWALGPHVLRIETAALAAAAVLRYLAHQPGRNRL